MALLDSGATHAVLDMGSVRNQKLEPCTVFLAGDQRQTWHQTPDTRRFFGGPEQSRRLLSLNDPPVGVV